MEHPEACTEHHEGLLPPPSRFLRARLMAIDRKPRIGGAFGLCAEEDKLSNGVDMSYKRDWSPSRSSSWSSNDSAGCPSLSPCSSASLSLPPSPPMHSQPPKRRPSAALSIAIPGDKAHTPNIDNNTVIYEPPATPFVERDTTDVVLAYPHGPVEVCAPNVFLYSEPSAEEAARFDVVINVAKEVPNPFDRPYHSPPSSVGSSCHSWERPEYVYVPWDHNTQLVGELSTLTALIRARSDEGKRVLIHCQCGVSRSASLVVAYVMQRYQWDLNTAYRHVKERSPAISPNMSLIYQLVDWQHMLRN